MRRVLPLIAVLLMAFAPAPFPKPRRQDTAASDLKQMQGEWVIAYEVTGGEKSVSPSLVRWQIENECLTVVDPDEVKWRRKAVARWRQPPKFNISLDAGVRPRRIDLRDKPGCVLRGIYRVTHDTLTVSFGGDRPSDLSGYGRDTITVFKRKRN